MKKTLTVIVSIILSLAFCLWLFFNFVYNVLRVEQLIDTVTGCLESDNSLFVKTLLSLVFVNMITIAVQYLLSFKLKVEYHIINITSGCISFCLVSMLLLCVVREIGTFVGQIAKYYQFDFYGIEMIVYILLLVILPLIVLILSTISEIKYIKRNRKEKTEQRR